MQDGLEIWCIRKCKNLYLDSDLKHIQPNLRVVEQRPKSAQFNGWNFVEKKKHHAMSPKCGPQRFKVHCTSQMAENTSALHSDPFPLFVIYNYLCFEKKQTWWPTCQARHDLSLWWLNLTKTNDSTHYTKHNLTQSRTQNTLFQKITKLLLCLIFPSGSTLLSDTESLWITMV